MKVISVKTIKYLAIFYLAQGTIQALGMEDSNNNSPVTSAVSSPVTKTGNVSLQTAPSASPVTGQKRTVTFQAVQQKNQPKKQASDTKESLDQYHQRIMYEHDESESDSSSDSDSDSSNDSYDSDVKRYLERK